ncbi:hypothetical protein RvY_01144 [Ramazzottius varieornatus]|uniref:Uncharacterized protein n=1 Tax=Ramazzottius varieornatus TaxID=947166 RepID=A0A1D1UMF7_RAMVA|nr:hypothetical protein RvY_01144 [Ramazzottius varieornatus]
METSVFGGLKQFMVPVNSKNHKYSGFSNRGDEEIRYCRVRFKAKEVDGEEDVKIDAVSRRGTFRNSRRRRETCS